MMKVSVRVRGEWLAIPCNKGQETLGWLGDEALRRYQKIKPQAAHLERPEKVQELRKTRGGAILDKDDVIKTVLDDNDFVSVGKGLALSKSYMSDILK